MDRARRAFHEKVETARRMSIGYTTDEFDARSSMVTPRHQFAHELVEMINVVVVLRKQQIGQVVAKQAFRKPGSRVFVDGCGEEHILKVTTQLIHERSNS